LPHCIISSQTQVITLLDCQLKSAPGDRRNETRRISISFDDINSANALNVVEQLLD
jgi:hypothetical protein